MSDTNASGSAVAIDLAGALMATPEFDHAAILAQASGLLETSLSFDDTLRAVGEVVVPGLAHWCTIDVFDEQGTLQRAWAASADEPDMPRFPDWLSAQPPEETPDNPLWRVIRTATPDVTSEVDPERLARAARHSDHARFLSSLPPFSQIIMPLVARGQTLGVLFLGSMVKRHRYSDRDFAFVSLIAQRAAYALDNARLHQQLLRQNEQLQQARELMLQTEAELREKEQRLSLILHAVSSFLVLVQVKGPEDYRVVEANSAYLEALGRSREEVVGKRFEDFLPPEIAERSRMRCRDVLRAAGRPVHYPATDIVLPRRQLIAETLIMPILGERGEITHMLASTRDVTDVELAHRALEESEERYKMLFASSPVPMWLYDPETLDFLEVNEAAQKHYGYSADEFMRMNIRDLYPPEDVPWLEERVRQARADGGVVRIERRHRRKSGGMIFADIFSREVNFRGRRVRVVFALDVSEQRQLQDQLLQAHKMEAVGRLAGGVAHDFNNILTAISGFAELAAAQLGPREVAREEIAEITRAAERASTLTRQLLAYSRKQMLQPRLTDLNAVIRDLSRMLRRLIGEHIALETELAEDLPAVVVDPGQFEQVMVNLAVNARDAMPRGGRLTISTALERRSLGGAAEGEVVAIRVQDTGRGMDDATRERLFEPFFTTKDVGEGTGLGLATVYGVIRQSGGHIEVDSEPGAGATFAIFFPRAGGEAATDDPSTRPQSNAPRGETILVVEDDAQLRRLATSILGKSGYRVLEASSGDEALQLMAAWSGRVDLLLTDVIMPGMSGPVLARRLATLRPGLRTLFMSGYTADALSDYRTIDGDMDLLAKPFTSDSLVRRVREALDRAKIG